jgi:acetyl-CoA carboxylase carboxyltransferase component
MDDQPDTSEPTTELVEELLRRREVIRAEMGGAAKVAKLKAAGGRTARDWIGDLLDPDSFIEIGAFVRAERPDERPTTPGDGLIGGHGLVDGRPISVTANDVTVKGGTGSRAGQARGSRIYEQALKFGNPYVLFGQAGGVRVQDLIGSEKMAQQGGSGGMWTRHRRIPMVTAIVGRSYGSSSFSAAASDFAVQLRGTAMALTSPRVIEMAVGDTITEEDLGGVDVHNSKTGQIDLSVDTPEELVAAVRDFLSYLPSNGKSLPPRREVPKPRPIPELRTIVPAARRRGYDMRKVVAKLVDEGRFLELKPKFGRSLVTALARIDGRSVGIVASNPMFQGGAMTPDACDKAMSFVTLCDSFHIPLIFLADTPGFLVGAQVEHNRALHKAVALNQCLLQVGVPVLAFVLRKAYGLSYPVMIAGRSAASLIVGWPTAEISFMDPEVAVNVVYGPELDKLDPEARAAAAASRAAEIGKATTAYDAAIGMGLDEIIDPADTPVLIAQALDRLMANYDLKRERTLAYWPTCY